MPKSGRPSSFTQKLSSTICEKLSVGQSLREICRSNKMPNISTVMRWLGSNGDFREQYARAREAQAEYLVDEIIEIADDGTNDWMLRQHGERDEVGVPNHEHINRSRLRIDARKWAASKLAPKKYGDRTDVDLTISRDVTQISDAELISLLHNYGATSPAGGKVNPDRVH